MNTLECPSCKNTVFAPDVKCEMCGFPLKGTEQEKAIFIGRKYARIHEQGELNKTLKRLKIFLFGFGGLHLLILMIFLRRFETTQLLIAIFEASVYIVFGILAKKHPFVILIAALCFYLFCQFFMPILVFPFYIHIVVITSFIIGIIKANSLEYTT